MAERTRWASLAVFAENPAGGFPDDTDAPGPTLISTATLEDGRPLVSRPHARRSAAAVSRES